MKPFRFPSRRAALFSFLLGVLLASAAWAQPPGPQNGAEDEEAPPASDQPVEVRYEIYVVSEVTEDGETQERFTEATSARPGQTVEYRVFATNTGDSTLPDGLVTVIGPVPDGTEFVEDSATPSSDRILTEYSADGGESFGEPPVLVGPEGDREAVDPAEYDAVRWTLLVPMEPEQEEAFFYRVTIDR